MNLEKEICLFAQLTIFSIGKLNTLPYVLMTQGDLNSTTSSGLRITNRVRMSKTGDSGAPVFSTATKFRLPRKNGSVTSGAAEVEFEVTEEDFNAIMGSCESRYLKRRYSFDLGDGLKAEVDRYYDNEQGDFSRIVKIDIENGDEHYLPDYLSKLEAYGIFISNLINPPSEESQAIKDRITELMTRTWNLVSSNSSL